MVIDTKDLKVLSGSLKKNQQLTRFRGRHAASLLNKLDARMARRRRYPTKADVPHPRYGDIVLPSGKKLSEAQVRNSFWRYRSEIIFPESAIEADVTRQNFSIYPRRYYVDILKKCRSCKRTFLFFAKEQQYWYEVLGFWIDADCVHCPECRASNKEIRRRFQRYSQRIGQSTLVDREFATLLGDTVFLWSAGVLRDEQKLRRLRNEARRRIPDDASTSAINDLVDGLAKAKEAEGIASPAESNINPTSDQ